VNLERLVTDWLRAEAPPRAPDGLLSSTLNRVAATAQPRVVWGRRWPAGSRRPSRPLLAIAATLVGLGLLGALAVGGGPSPRPLTSTPTQSPQTATPTASPSARPLAPGQQILARATWTALDEQTVTSRMVFNVPAGWMTDDQGRIFKVREGSPNGIGMQLGTIKAVYADPCHWAAGLAQLPDRLHGPNEPGYLEMANALARGEKSPVVTKLAGLGARKLTVHTPDDIQACDAGEFRRWRAADGRRPFAHRPGQIDEVWLLDPDREMAVLHVWYFADTADTDRAEMQAILKSMQFVYE
jgi:hypothetical protein